MRELGTSNILIFIISNAWSYRRHVISGTHVVASLIQVGVMLRSAVVTTPFFFLLVFFSYSSHDGGGGGSGSNTLELFILSSVLSCY